MLPTTASDSTWRTRSSCFNRSSACTDRTNFRESGLDWRPCSGSSIDTVDRSMPPRNLVEEPNSVSCSRARLTNLQGRSMTPRTMLLVEDNQQDELLILRALRKVNLANQVEVVR